MITLVTSAAYVNAEMTAEFGKLPPAFLPLGTRRLIEQQKEQIGTLDTDDLYLSLPENFHVSAKDAELLAELGVEVIPVPEGLSLGNSVLHCLRYLCVTGPVRILHGDTLLDGEGSKEHNLWATSHVANGYSWGYAFVDDGRIVGVAQDGQSTAEEQLTDVLIGYFTFSDGASLSRALQYSNGDFLTALSRYAMQHDVRALPFESWSDCGHLQTYYQARRAHASARAFNELLIDRGLVKKTSNQADKLKAEAAWLQSLPPTLLPFAARLTHAGEEEGRFSYTTEYEYLPTLQELFVFGRLEPKAWEGILAACCTCLEEFAAVPVSDAPEDSLVRLVSAKTFDRLSIFERDRGIDLSGDCVLNAVPLPSCWRIAEEMASIIAKAPLRVGNVMHGDFCFSNILYNSRTSRIRLIDPRGTIDGGMVTIGGDLRYDMAKLAHSVLGRYDLLIAGRYSLSSAVGQRISFDLDLPGNETSAPLERALLGSSVAGVSFDDSAVNAALVSLFLSMLPLHADRPDRQMAFLANALRLYQLCFEDKR